MFHHSLRTLARSGTTSASAAWRPVAVAARSSRTFASAAGPAFDWQDPLSSKSLLTEEEIAIGETAEAYCQERLLPRVLRMRSLPIAPRAMRLVHHVPAMALTQPC